MMIPVLMHKAEKYAVDMKSLPDSTKTYLLRNFGCARKVYNLYVDHLYGVLESQGYQGGERIPYIKYPTVKSFGKKFLYLKEADSLGLMNARESFEDAVKRFNEEGDYVSYTKRALRRANSGTEPLTFRGLKGMPKYHSKADGDFSYTTECQYPSSSNSLKQATIRLNKDMLHIPKLKRDIKLIIHRPFPEHARIGSVTMSMDLDEQMYASIEYSYTCMMDDSLRNLAMNEEDGSNLDGISIVGLDYSQEHFYVDSNGEKAEYPHFYRASEAKLAKLQRELARMEKGSSNYEKKKKEIQKLNIKIRNQRKDFLNKLSTSLAEQYDAVAVEDIDLRAMASSLKLGKNIHDNGFGMFREMLAKKLEEKGSILVKIDRWFPSTKRCHCCGAVNPEVVLGVKKWVCPSCRVEHNRDWNAAINIKEEGKRVLPIYYREWLKKDQESRAKAGTRYMSKADKPAP